MRDVVRIGLLLLLAAGCATAPEPDPQPPLSGRRVTTQVFPERGDRTGTSQPYEGQPQGGQEGSQLPTARPAEAVRGRILSVNPKLRFVIVDFPTRNLPYLDQKLGVWRMDHKVAEIKVSGPYRGTTVAADITAGEVKPGDMVRQEW